MNRVAVFAAAVLFSGAPLFACSGGGSETDAGSSSDAAGQTDAGSGGDAGATDVSSHDFYASCADPKKTYQFPTPAWETDGESATGKVLAIPANDAAAALLKEVRPKWSDQFVGIDGVPLNAGFFIALDGKATAADPARMKLYSLAGSMPFEVPATFTADLSDSKGTLIVKATRPLPTPHEGEIYILALYEGAVTGAKPLPACGAQGKAQEKYVTVASVLVDNNFGDRLQYALPFTPSRMSIELTKLYGDLATTPALEVESVAAAALDSFGEFNPDDATKAVLAPQAYKGILNTPLYQADLDNVGAFVVDHMTNIPKKQGVTKPGFVAALPAAGTAPYPTILWQHGGGHDKAALFLIAKAYAAAGFALVGIDLPYHGDRSKVPGHNGSDQDMADFDHPLKTRDNFRQAAADHMAVLTGIDALNAALKPLTSLDATFDKERIFMMGHSMGSLSGTITTGVAQALTGANLIAGGAPYRQLVAQGLFTLYIQDILNDRPKVETELLLTFAQTMLDGGDPLNYPSRYEDQAKRPMDVLVWESTADPMVNNPSTDSQALEFGASLVTPSNHTVAGMAEVALPASGNFGWTDVADKATRLLFQKDYAPVQGPALHMAPFNDPYVHATAAACFDGRLKDGACRVEQ